MAEIKVKLPTGETLKFPEGMSENEMADAIDMYLAQNKPQPQQPIQSEIPINTPSILGQDRSPDGSIRSVMPLDGVDTNMPLTPINPQGNPDKNLLKQIQFNGQGSEPLKSNVVTGNWWDKLDGGEIKSDVVYGGQNGIKSNVEYPFYEPSLLERMASSAADGLAGTLSLPQQIALLLEGTSPLVDLAEINPKAKEALENGFKLSSNLPDRKYFREDLLGFIPNAPFKSTEGKLLGGAVSGATSMLGLGGVPGAIIGASSGAFGQGAAELGLPAEYQIAAGLLGGFAPMGVQKAAGAIFAPKANQYLSQSVKGIDDQAFSKAETLFNEAQSAKNPLTVVEALSEASGGNPALQNLQRVIEQNPGGAPIMQQYLGGRNQANKAMADEFFNKLGPQLDDPTTIAPTMRDSAERSIKSEMDKAGEASGPFYNQAHKEIIPEHDFNNLLSSNEILKDTYKKIMSNPAFRQEMKGFPNNSVKTLDVMKQYIDDIIYNSTKPTSSIGKHELNSIRKARSELIDLADTFSPNYRSARVIYSQMLAENVDPLLTRPINKIAQTENIADQKKILMDPKAETLTPYLVRDTIKRLNAENPEVAAQFTRQALSTMFDDINKAVGSVKGETNKYGGANFANALTGNSRQAQNIRELIRNLPGGNSNLEGFNKMIDIFNAQGKRLPAGAQTEFNRQINNQLVDSGIISSALNYSTVNYGSVIRNWWNKRALGKNSEELARLITSPNGLKMLQSLKNVDKNSPKALANIIYSLIANNQLGKE